MKLLVVDWDYFFVSLQGSSDRHWPLYDWGCRETDFNINFIWIPRAMAFFQARVSLPGLSGEQENFWDRVTLNPGARLFYGDSNTHAASPRVSRGITEVLLLDAHHDSGYNEGEPYSFAKLRSLGMKGVWHCDNWMILYFLLGCKTEIWYPRWKTWALEAEGRPALLLNNRRFDPGDPIEGVDRVFVCRSGAWVPPWLDEDFERFIDAVPVKKRVNLDGTSLVRGWDEEELRQYSEVVRPRA